MNKRDFLKSSAALGLSTITAKSLVASSFNNSNGDLKVNAQGEYELPPLPYGYDALEPHIDEQTMRLHHDIHHAGYVRGLNSSLDKINQAIEAGDYSLIQHWEREIAFNGSGHFLHTIFWDIMGPDQGQRSSTLNRYINNNFGSFDNFRSYFIAAASQVEGSGWGILTYEPAGDRLMVLQAEKHQNLTQWMGSPILCVDVWEHAYYLKYQNKRGDYLNAFFNVINWDSVSKRLDELL